MQWSILDSSYSQQLLLDRILRKSTADEQTGCLLWQGAKDRGGYGLIQIEGRTRPVHRVLWEMLNGRIPEGLYLLHACDVRTCVEPSHLRTGTAKENIDD